MLIRPLADDAVAALADAIDAEDAADARRAAIDLARLGLDLQLPHRPVGEVDMDRLGLWAAQLRLDADEDDAAAANGDLFALDYVRERIRGTLDASDAGRINALLEELNGLIRDGDMPAVAEAASALGEAIANAAGP